MPPVDRLAKLFQAIAQQDLARASAIASEIAGQEEQKGHHAAAQRLKGAIHGTGPAKIVRRDSQSAVPANGALLATALAPLRQVGPLADIALRAGSRRELQAIVLEWQNRLRLNELGIGRRSKLLFHGPPGCGKSLAASALGYELSLPTYVIRFDAVVGAYLGQTAVHLRELFHYAEVNPCVLLFDEIDALGKKRGNPLDVGELDRIVIALLQELEHSNPAGLIVATSNLPGHLDAALWRRFDLAVEFPRPTKSEIAKFGARISEQRDFRLSAATKRRITRASSYADAENIIIAELRTKALSGIEVKKNGQA